VPSLAAEAPIAATELTALIPAQRTERAAG
jgi:hypothetical protein